MGISTTATAESKFHVLAVDDNLVDRKVIERMLKTASFHVTTVESGSKALEFLGIHENDQNKLICPSVSPNNNQQEMKVNLVITDYCMPGMTGYDLLKKIKESSSLRDIPVVIMSSENVPSRISRCLEEGAEEFFLKPVRLSDLNKLKQSLNARLKDQKLEKKEQQEIELQTIDSQLQQLQKEQLPQLPNQVVSELQPLQKEQLPQLPNQVVSESQPLQQEQLPQLQQQQPTTPNNNKRKTMEDGLPQERARPKYEYDGITTVI